MSEYDAGAYRVHDGDGGPEDVWEHQDIFWPPEDIWSQHRHLRLGGDRAISAIVVGPGGEDPIGPDLQDAERLLDQGRCDAAPAHRSDNAP